MKLIEEHGRIKAEGEPSFSRRATSYLTVRGIDLRLAWDCGVRERDGAIIWPTVDAEGKASPRRRRLGEGPGPKVRGMKGRSLGVWWPLGRPTDAHLVDVMVCEGESDALSALSTLAGAHDSFVRVASVPGASFPARVLASELRSVGARVAALAFDGDLAGATSADRIAAELVAEGIGARILAVPHGEDLASTLGGSENAREWLARALLEARPVGVREAALVAETVWLRRRCLELQAQRERNLRAVA